MTLKLLFIDETLSSLFKNSFLEGGLLGIVASKDSSITFFNCATGFILVRRRHVVLSS